MRATTITLRKDYIGLFGYALLITMMILLLSLFNNVQAQTKLGIRGGVSVSEPGLNSTLGSTSTLTKAFAGIDVALVAEFKIAKRLGLQAELGYNEKGIKLGTGTNINVFGSAVPLGVQTTTKIRLLELPLLAKYQIGQGVLKGYAIAGPTMSYALSGNFKTTGSLLTEINLVNQPIDLGSQNRLGLGFMGGVGLELDRGPGTLFIDARYNHQSLKINNLPIANVNFNNNGVAFNIGYKFTI